MLPDLGFELILWVVLCGLAVWVTVLRQQRVKQGAKISSKRIFKIPDTWSSHSVLPAGPELNPGEHLFLLVSESFVRWPYCKGSQKSIRCLFFSAGWQYLTTAGWYPGHWWLSEYSKCQFKARTNLIRMERGSDGLYFMGQSFLIHFNNPREWYWL